MSAAVSKFVTDLALHFPPKHAKPEHETPWLKSMAEALRGYPADILDEAAKHLIATRKYTTFPLPAECKQACLAIAEYRRFLARSEALPGLRKSEGDEWSSERVKLAYDLIKSGMGRQAAKDDPCWVLGLWHFCRKNQRLPEWREVEKIRREAGEFDLSYRDCLSGNAGPLSQALAGLGGSMIAKREKLCAEVLGR
jgi:hypothetical protein